MCFEFNQPSGGTAGPVFTLHDRPELRIDGTRLADTGSLSVEDAQVYGPELGFNWKNFYAQGEYYRYDIDRRGASEANFDAWYVQATYILTGETRPYDMKSASFGAPKPKGPFGFGGSIGGVWNWRRVIARRISTIMNPTPPVSGRFPGVGNPDTRGHLYLYPRRRSGYHYAWRQLVSEPQRSLSCSTI